MASKMFVKTRMEIRDDPGNQWNHFLVRETLPVFQGCQNAAKIVPISQFGIPEFQVELLCAIAGPPTPGIRKR
jgi:hypothetical protein